MAAKRWYVCPDCGDVRHTDDPVCEINGAGARMSAIPAWLARRLIQESWEATRDDGTLVRVGPFAFGRAVGTPETGGSPTVRWFVKEYRDGEFRRAAYGDDLVEAARRFLRPTSPS